MGYNNIIADNTIDKTMSATVIVVLRDPNRVVELEQVRSSHFALHNVMCTAPYYIFQPFTHG
jgi:hypothetical protein